MFSETAPIKRQGRPRQWCHHLSAMEGISKLAITPGWLGPVLCVLAGNLGAAQGSHFTILPLAGHRVPVVHRSITSVWLGQMPRFSCNSWAPATPSF